VRVVGEIKARTVVIDSAAVTALSRVIFVRNLALLLLPLSIAGAPLLGAQPDEGYVGAKACGRCHDGIQREWTETLHSKTMQPATIHNVKGDFAVGKVVLRGSTYLLLRRDNSYYIAESDLTGKPWEHRVDYTLGDRRFQHYLITLLDGRILVVPPTWDILRKKWDLSLDIDNPQEGTGDATLLWNKDCYSCHVSQGKKNFDLENLRYRTTWQDFGANCEACHGPGAEHIAAATGLRVSDAEARTRTRQAIVNPARLDALRSTAICAQCHSLRDIYADNFKAGADYYDFFTPVMEYRLPSEDSTYWPDGRPRQSANEAFGLWQSRCFLDGGATCTSCHAHPHTVDVRQGGRPQPTSDALCTGCHAKIAASVSEHTHHRANTPGSSCIACHMPAAVVSLKTRMRDHSISIPVPENTIRHKIPNACNVCHHDKDAAWAARQMNAWYGDTSRQKLIRRADAFTQARQGDPTAVPQLLQILSDPSGGPLIRANAVGYLGNFPDDPSAYDAVLHSFTDADPLVRATAAATIKPSAAQRESVATDLVGLLRDPLRTVRMSTAIAMVAMGVRPFAGEDGERYERAKELYRARAELNSDDAQQDLAAGRFFSLSGDMARAVDAFRAALKLDPKIPAQYYLARSMAAKGDYASARQVLVAIPRDDQQYPAAQQLLAEIEARDAGQSEENKSSSNESNSGTDARFLAGQLSYRNGQYGAALRDLEQALQELPHAEWATKAQIYRAICLEKLGRGGEAETSMEALSGQPDGRQNVELQLAFAELLNETGRTEEAVRRVDALITSVPKAPMAHFWRAKLLLELQRPDDAARAAEEAIRLLPEFPEAHGVLLKIYQTQGRTKEAARQAEWLRDYQRRMESH
jgi:tetratricopeptide (TPR) repeat protein